MKALWSKLKNRSVGALGRALQAIDRWSPIDLHLERISFMSHTFLFRDLEQCREMLTEFYAATKRDLRILCVGCATGQEPYSLAILCSDAGVPVHITAIDISESAIDVARKATYNLSDERRKAEEGPDNEALKLMGKYAVYFERDENPEGAWSVRQDIKQIVEFNVKDVDDLQYENAFDFIFCKKMLRYLPKQKRRVALALMKRALRTDVQPSHIILDNYTKRLLGLPAI